MKSSSYNLAVNSKSLWRCKLKLYGCILIICLIGLVSGVSYGFRVGLTTSKTAIHEDITASAIGTNAGLVNATFVNNVNAGVVNTDFTHQFEPPYHFDDSTWTNSGFDDGFGNLHSLLQSAKQEAITCDTLPCTINPLFLQPLHDTFRGVVDDIEGTYWDLAFNSGCFLEPACPSSDFVQYATDTTEGVILALADDNPDPDNDFFTGMFQMLTGELQNSLGGHCGSDGCFQGLENMLPSDQSFQSDVQYLKVLYYELQAYPAWQHLGHAFHGAQDLFAHSNYVELAAGLPGPPCPPSLQLSWCSSSDIRTATKGLAPNALKIPTMNTGSAHETLNMFRSQFSKATLAQIIPNPSLLQTGFIDWVGDWCASDYMITDPLADARQLLPGAFQNPNPPRSLDGYLFCHYLTPTTAGLNKDEPYQYERTDDEVAHQDFDYARWAALQVSQALWTSFLNDITAQPPPLAAPPALRNMVLSVQRGSDKQGSVINNWVIVTARDSQTGALVKGNVSFGVNTTQSKVLHAAGSAKGSTGAKIYYPNPCFAVVMGALPTSGANGPVGKPILANPITFPCQWQVTASGYVPASFQ